VVTDVLTLGVWGGANKAPRATKLESCSLASLQVALNAWDTKPPESDGVEARPPIVQAGGSAGTIRLFSSVCAAAN